MDLAGVELVGHRGCADHNPENTVRAFAAASERLSAVEVDPQVERKRPGLYSAVREALAGRDHRSVRLSTFSAPALAAVTQSSWTPETGLLFGDYPSANLDLADSLGCRNVHPHVDCCLDTDVVDQAHDRGFRVIAWGLDDVCDAPALAEHDVDSVTTDTWDVPGR